MLLYHKTEVVQVWDDNFPRNIFDFKECAYLSSPDVDNSILVDVIGRITECETPVRKDVKGKETKITNFTIENIEGATLSCTLFGRTSNKLMLAVEKSNVSIIVIMQFGWLNTYNNEVKVTNTYNVSRILLNANIPEVTVFNERMKYEGCIAIPIIPMSRPSVASVEQDLEFSRDKFRTLMQLCEMAEEGKFWVFGHVSAIESPGDWCFVSCTKCFKKMMPVDDAFVCCSCGHEDRIPIWRFKVRVRVFDDTGNVALILWDKEVQNIIGLFAAQMVRKHGEKSLPGEISNMVGLEAAFKVKIKSKDVGGQIIAFPINEMSSDVKVIDKFFKIEKNNNVDISEGEIITSILPPKLKSVIPSSVLSVKRCLNGDFSNEDLGKKIRKMCEEDKK